METGDLAVERFQMLTEQDVTTAYLLILGRPPESEDTIKMQIKTNKDFVRLRHSLMTSGEFLKNVQSDGVLQGALLPANDVLNSVRKRQSVARRFSLRRG